MEISLDIKNTLSPIYVSFGHNNSSCKCVGTIFLTLPNRDSDLVIAMPETDWTFSANRNRLVNRTILKRPVEIIYLIFLIWQTVKQGLERLSDLLKVIHEVGESEVFWLPLKVLYLISRSAFHVVDLNKLIGYHWYVKWQGETFHKYWTDIIFPFSGH